MARPTKSFRRRIEIAFATGRVELGDGSNLPALPGLDKSPACEAEYSSLDFAKFHYRHATERPVVRSLAVRV
jgi:hypothetical protein